MDPKIKAKVDQINQKILELEFVQIMKELEKQIETESDFLVVEQTLFDLQKKMVQSFDDPKQFERHKETYETLLHKLQNQPLYINYRYHLEQTNELIVSIQEQLKTIGEKQ